MLEINKIHCGDCLELMKEIPNYTINLTVTSPPYDNLRDYNGYVFDFENIAKELYRVTKDGGVVVWVVGDATIKGSETGTSFKQALYFKEIGFNLHDTMIWKKPDPIPLTHNRYEQSFEYMFIFSRGKPKTFNPVMVQTKYGGKTYNMSEWSNKENKQAKRVRDEVITRKNTRIEHNTWNISINDGVKVDHPAKFPEQLAHDHITSWSNKNDLILDPMCGSGTTCKMAKLNNRNYIGIDISKEYVDIANKRLEQISKQEEILSVSILNIKEE